MTKLIATKIGLFTLILIIVLSLITYKILPDMTGGDSEKLKNLVSKVQNIKFDLSKDKIIDITKHKDGVLISHEIAFNNGLCANEDGREIPENIAIRDNLFDELAIRVVITNSNISQIPDFKKRISPDEGGYSDIEKIKISGVEGYRVLNAVEFCGTVEHYFPIDNDIILNISMDSDAIASRNLGKLKNIPGALSTDEVDKIIETIVREIFTI